MKISREDVKRVAELAYLDLSEAELETYRAQIDEILEYIGKLNELDTSKVEPMAQVLTEVLAYATDPEPPYFRAPKVIER